MRSFLGVPILIHGQVFGNLYLTGKLGSDQFSDRDEEIAVALAGAAGVAIENAQLYEEAEVRQRWLEATAEVTGMLAGAVSGREALQTIVDRAREVARADVACIASGTDPEQLRLEVVSGVPMTPDVRESLALGRYLAVQVAATGDALTLDDLTTGAGGTASDVARAPRVGGPDGPQLGPVVLVPIRLGAGTQGVLGLGWTPEHRDSYHRLDLSMPASFAEQATLALHLARLRDDRERLALLEDRDRIGRDLHDW
ncbi:GAF domain-containing protein [Nocardioides alcanivorans]|uniref:GAF domain-containing protein n=1 Tax=Nocardioides alcanivorans TaxID=2897352 RepID=UPI0035E25963